MSDDFRDFRCCNTTRARQFCTFCIASGLSSSVFHIHREHRCNSRAWNWRYWQRVSWQRPAAALSEYVVCVSICGNYTPCTLMKRASRKSGVENDTQGLQLAGHTKPSSLSATVSQCRLILPSVLLRRCANHHHKVLTTSQPDYLHNLISVQSTGIELAPRLSCHPSSTIRIFLITNHQPLVRSFTYASPYLWN